MMGLPKEITDDLMDKAIVIFRKEGTFLKFLQYKKRGAAYKMQFMLEDLFNRYGQKLDGDVNFKFKIDDDDKVENKNV